MAKRYQSCEELNVCCPNCHKYISVLLNFHFNFRPFNVSLDSAIDTYFPTHIRCGPWLIGVMLGYIFYQTRNQRIVINKVCHLYNDEIIIYFTAMSLYSFISLSTQLCGYFRLARQLQFWSECSRCKAWKILQADLQTQCGWRSLATTGRTQ